MRPPERVVHVQSFGARSTFRQTESFGDYAVAKALTEVGEDPPNALALLHRGQQHVPVEPCPRRARLRQGLTTKCNWASVGNDIPVFFIQDMIKFPDLAHAVK